MKPLIYLFASFLFFIQIIAAQSQVAKKFACGYSFDQKNKESKHSKENNNQHTTFSTENCTAVYDPDNIKIVRVNVHYVLTQNPDNPGNFTEVSDGKGNNNYTGFDFAEALINQANEAWKRNFEMTLYLPRFPEPPPEVLPKGVQLLLDGVYFHRNDQIYFDYRHPQGPCSSNTNLVNTFGEALGEAVNIFVVEDTHALDDDDIQDCVLRGVGCTNAANAAVTIENTWCHFPASYIVTEAAKLTNHEIGHVFGLDHVFQCSQQCPEFDIDKEYNGDPNTACGLGGRKLWTSGSNNVMGYNPLSHALSPCQINTIHENLGDGYTNYVESCTSVCNVSTINCCEGSYPPLGLSGISIIPCCLPPNPFFNDAETAWVCDVNSEFNIWLDARASWNETAYKIQIIKYIPGGNNKWYDGPWIAGEAGFIDLANLTAEPTFEIEPGFDYWVKLIVKNDCDEWEDKVKILRIELTPQSCGEICTPAISKLDEFCAMESEDQQYAGTYQLSFLEENDCALNLEGIANICWTVNNDIGYFEGNITEVCGLDLFEVEVISTGIAGALVLTANIEYWTADGLINRKVTFLEEILDCCQPEIIYDGSLCVYEGDEPEESITFSLQFNLPEEDCFSRLGRICWIIESDNGYFLENGVQTSICSPHPDEVDAFRTVEVFLFNQTGLLEIRAEVFVWDLNDEIKLWTGIRFSEEIENCCKPVLVKKDPKPFCLSEDDPALESGIIELLWNVSEHCGTENILNICWEINEEIASFSNYSSPVCDPNLLEMDVILSGQTGTLLINTTITYQKADGSLGEYLLEWSQEILHCVSRQSREPFVKNVDKNQKSQTNKHYPKARMFPNPSHSIINIQLENRKEEPEAITFELRDIANRKIHSNILSGKFTTIDLSDLKGGIYIIVLRDRNFEIIQTNKIIKL